MIIQHILTERIFRKVFNNPDFVKRNIIAHEIDKVIEALTSQSFSREGFLTKLDRFYHAIETTAATIEDYSQKQSFLNTVYERFFQGFSVKVADTHGIVYTPQPIVDFMVRSVDQLLRAEFGRSLGDPGVHLLDPFVGTGNFIMRLMREIPKAKLAPKYAARTPLQRSHAAPLLHRLHEHRARLLRNDRRPTNPSKASAWWTPFNWPKKDNQLSSLLKKILKRVEMQQKSPDFRHYWQSPL